MTSVAAASNSRLIFRQLFDPASSTYTYILGCSRTRDAVIVDTVWEQTQRDAIQLKRLNLNLKYILDTHVHADHVSGALKLHLFLGLCGQSVPIVHGWNSGVQFPAQFSDIRLQLVRDWDKIEFGDRFLVVRETPGHTDHHLSFVLDDKSLLLSGCSLYIGGCGRTDFQGGSSKQMFESVMTKMYDSLPDDCVLYPGHNYQGCMSSTIGEEKQFNQRLPANQSLEKFEEIMKGLNLPYPKKIDFAVPANLMGGVIDDEEIVDGR